MTIPKHTLHFPLILLLILLTACTTPESAPPAPEEAAPKTTAQAAAPEENMPESNFSEENTAEESQTEKEKELRKISLKSPGYGYVSTVSTETAAVPLSLSVLHAAANNIIDTGDWFLRNDLYLPSVSGPYACEVLMGSTGILSGLDSKWQRENQTCFYDDTYVYTAENMQGILNNPQAPYMDCLLTIYDKKSEAALWQFDFSDFCFESEEMRSQEIYTELDITWAAIYENVLYVSLFYNGYAQPNTSFLVAVSLETEEVLWKSDSLVCNSYNFLIIENLLLCGYGFTNELDYLYQLDLKTGKVADQLLLKSKPDYLVWKEEQLYIRCYNTDYILQVNTKS